jgi:hypothetical protein
MIIYKNWKQQVADVPFLFGPQSRCGTFMFWKLNFVKFKFFTPDIHHKIMSRYRTYVYYDFWLFAVARTIYYITITAYRWPVRQQNARHSDKSYKYVVILEHETICRHRYITTDYQISPLLIIGDILHSVVYQLTHHDIV